MVSGPRERLVSDNESPGGEVEDRAASVAEALQNRGAVRRP